VEHPSPCSYNASPDGEKNKNKQKFIEKEIANRNKPPKHVQGKAVFKGKCPGASSYVS
jgi:hypothetical protein